MVNESSTFHLEGLSCMNCAVKFEENIESIQTVKDVKVNFGAAKVTVKGEITIEEIEQAGSFDGIKVASAEKEQVDEAGSFWNNFWQKRTNRVTVYSLLFIIAGYISYFALGEKHVLTIGMFILAIVVGGYDLFKVGFTNLIKFEFDMKTLMTIAIIGAALIGEWAEGAVVIVLFAISEALEDYSVDKARESIKTLMKVAPNQATIIRNGEAVLVDVKQIEIGEMMLIKPGEKIAMDGIVEGGQSTVGQAAITGESIPVQKGNGDDVFAGTINEEGSLEVRVTKHVEDTKIAKIIHLVEEAQAERAPSQKFVDKFARYYTPAIMMIALFVAILPPLLLSLSWSEWVYSGLAVLVVGCPCALIISTPVAIVTAIGNAARNGVLIKGGIHLEETGHLNVVAFDKTGTLTEGTPEVTDVEQAADLTKEEILAISMAIESFSQHPLATAIIRKAKKERIQPYVAEQFKSITGKGARALVDDVMYYIGSPKLFKDLLQDHPQLIENMKELEKSGKTVMVLGTEQEVKGYIAVADEVRRNSSSIIKKLYKLGIEKIVMLTGDNKETGHFIAERLGMNEVRAELLPEEKLQTIKELQESNGNVAMVGDGINDAPALAASSVGIAMGGAGTDTALETADIALMADDLEKLPYTIALSRKALQVIKQNISLALFLKIIALLLVIPGWLTLWIAIFADVGATLIVVLNSMRLTKFKL